MSGLEKHTRPWTSAHPGCLIFLLDQSGSMELPFAGNVFGAGLMKKDAVATVVNNCIDEIRRRCVKGEVVSPRVFMALIGYGGDAAYSVFSLEGRELVSITELAANPLRVEERIKKEMTDTGEFLEYPVRVPIWVEARAAGETPMTKALEKAYQIAANWIPDHRECFPPLVINITDGEATDGDPKEPASRLRQLETDDGEVLLFNCQISETPGAPIVFPAPGDPLPPNTFAEILFEMSSELPNSMRSLAIEMGVNRNINKGARGFLFNTDARGVAQLIKITTEPQLAVQQDKTV